MTFAEKLQVVLDARGLSQNELARRTGMSQPAVNRFLSGKQRPFADQVFKIAREMDVSCDYLLDDGVEGAPSPERTEYERRVWEIVRAIGAEAAWRRLVGASGLPEAPITAENLPLDPSPPQLRRPG